MKAIVFKKPMDINIETLAEPTLKENEVLVRIKVSGICTNDIRDYKGSSYSYPRIGGHEYSGIIEKMGNGVNTNRFALGQKVVSYIINDCKECYYCKRKEENICHDFPYSKTFQNLHGYSGYYGFSEFVVTEANDLFIYPEYISFEKMAFTEPLACVINSVNRANIQLGDDVLIIGGGTMGLLHVMVAYLKGARIFLSEPQADRRRKAMSLGCHEVFDPIKEDVNAKIKALTDGRGADIVFDTTEIPKIAEDSIEMTAPNGRCILFSSLHPNEPLSINGGTIHSHQKTITGAVSPTISSYHQAVSMIGKGLLDPTILIEKIFDYTEIKDAMEFALRPDTYKVMIKFGDL